MSETVYETGKVRVFGQTNKQDLQKLLEYYEQWSERWANVWYSKEYSEFMDLYNDVWEELYDDAKIKIGIITVDGIDRICAIENFESFEVWEIPSTATDFEPQFDGTATSDFAIIYYNGGADTFEVLENAMEDKKLPNI